MINLDIIVQRFDGTLDDNNKKKIEQKYNIARAKIIISALIVARHLAFLLTNFMMNVMKKVFHDSEIAKELYLNIFEVVDIIKLVIAPCQQERFKKFLMHQKFSIIIDESTSKSSKHCLCVVTRYFDSDAGKVHDSLWDVILLYENEYSTANAENILSKVIESFKTALVPICNAICFASDTCNLLMGKISSVSVRLKKILQHLLIVKCRCHLGHLCARDTVAADNMNSLKFVSSVYNYIEGSSKRSSNWQTFQERIFRTHPFAKPLKILKPIYIRWLSNYESLERVVSRWTALKLFLRTEEWSQDVETLLQSLENDLLHLNCMFLEFILNKFYCVNKLFQSETPIIPASEDSIHRLYFELLKLYMYNDYIEKTDILEIDPQCTSNMKPPHEIFIGSKAQEFLDTINISEEEKNSFF